MSHRQLSPLFAGPRLGERERHLRSLMADEVNGAEASQVPAILARWSFLSSTSPRAGFWPGNRK